MILHEFNNDDLNFEKPLGQPESVIQSKLSKLVSFYNKMET